MRLAPQCALRDLAWLEEFEAEWGKRYPVLGQAWR